MPPRILYPRPAAVVATNRQPGIIRPLGTGGLNSGSQPAARQAPALQNPLARKPVSR